MKKNILLLKKKIKIYSKILLISFITTLIITTIAKIILNYYWGDYFKKWEKNKVVDTLNRLAKIKKVEKFSFDYLAFIIYKNPDKFIESLYDIINSYIISNKKLYYIIDEIINKFNKNEIKSNNEKILELIKYLYKLLKDKNEEIKSNN